MARSRSAKIRSALEGLLPPGYLVKVEVEPPRERPKHKKGLIIPGKCHISKGDKSAVVPFRVTDQADPKSLAFALARSFRSLPAR